MTLRFPHNRIEEKALTLFISGLSTTYPLFIQIMLQSAAHQRFTFAFIVLLLWIISSNIAMSIVRDPIVLHHADVLSGSESPMGPIRQLRGNVSLSQGNVSVKCDYALWNMNGNSVEMSGNVIVKQGTMTLYMPYGSYDGITRLARGRGGVKVVDRGRTVQALYGDYSTESYLARLFGNVMVEDDSTIIHADSAHYDRESRKSLAFGRVIVLGKQHSAIIEGMIAESIPTEGLTRITGRPILFLIDSSMTGDTSRISIPVKDSKKSKQSISQKDRDSLIIRKVVKHDTMTVTADTLETFQKEILSYTAKRNVEIHRSSMSAVCEHALFSPKDDTLQLHGRPMIWVDSTIMNADSISLIMKKRSLRRIDARGSAFTLTKDDTLRPERAQQLSGREIAIIIENDTISSIQSIGQAKSLYFLLSEKGLPEGAAKNSCDTIVVRFEKGEPESIVWIGGVQGQVYPETEVEGKESSHYLPGLPENRKRPQKKIRNFTSY
ncbi:MAG: OstA-like protein [bacterium]